MTGMRAMRAMAGAIVCAISIVSHGQVATTGRVASQAGAKAPSQQETAAERKLRVSSRAWSGDLDGMLARRMIRVAAPYSRTIFYLDKGRERGVGVELVRDFERWLNQKYARQLGKRPLTIYIGAVSRDKLLSGLDAGEWDIAIGNLTVTPEREKVVDFFAPQDARTVDEIVVAGPAAPPLASLDDLAGKTVNVRRSSSYADSLASLNSTFRAAGKPEMNLVFMPEELEDEDLMEMANAGLLEILVVDDWKARMWAQILPKLTVHAGLILRDGGRTGWAVRKHSPQLVAAFEEFYVTWARKQGVINYRFVQANKRVKQLRDPSNAVEYKRFQDTLELFEKYGERYGFDPLMLAAQGYQESTIDQSKRSRVGAIGVMQIMPATGAGLKVGDITLTEPNIHGGAKYMDELLTRYFADAGFDAQNRTLFGFASYNAGPGNISRMRKEAAKRGLNPDRWFNNVEVVTAEKIGMETTTYVRNIYKYYASYRLQLEAQERLLKAREALAPAK